MPDPDLPITHTTLVTEDQIDHLGHMNVRFYGVASRAGTAEVLRRLAPGDGDPIAFEVPDVATRHLREQLLGARLSVRSGVLESRARRLRIYHELVNDDTGDLAASFVHRVRVLDDRPRAWADPGDLDLEDSRSAAGPARSTWTSTARRWLPRWRCPSSGRSPSAIPE